MRENARESVEKFIDCGMEEARIFRFYTEIQVIRYLLIKDDVGPARWNTTLGNDVRDVLRGAGLADKRLDDAWEIIRSSFDSNRPEAWS